MKDVSILNNTAGGRSGPTSTDDNCLESFGGSFLGVTNYTIQGNTCSNVGGTSGSTDYGNGFSASSATNAVTSFNLVFNNGRNTNSCGSAYPFGDVSALNPVFKFNEAYGQSNLSGGGCDNGGFDMDLSTINGVVEYNYSHNNFGPGFNIFGGDQGPGYSNNDTVRFDISENDKTQNSGGQIHIQNPGNGFNIYNNTVWQPTLSGAQGPSTLGFCCANSYTQTGLIANNIFVAQFSSNTTSTLLIGNSSGNVTSMAYTFKANTYYAPAGGTTVWLNGSAPAITTLAGWQAFATGGDTGAIQGAPGFVGTGGTAGNCTWTPNLNNGPQSCPFSVYAITNAAAQRGTGFSTNSISGGDGGRDYNAVSIPNGVGTGYNMGADGH
jgi:hypothetical protein